MNTAMSVPCPATYVDGRKGSMILMDPHGFLMKYHKKDCNRKFYYCHMKENVGCKVAVSVDIATDIIVHHN